VESKRVWALAAIALGCALLFDALGFVDVSFSRLLAVYWPILLVVWGVQKAARVARIIRQGRTVPAKAKVGPLTVIVLGALVLARNLGWLGEGTVSLWKLAAAFLLIYFGVGLLEGRPKDREVISSLLGELHYGQNPFALSDTCYTMAVGDLHLDLTQAIVPNREVVLELNLGAGSIEILVPRDLAVAVHAHTSAGELTIFDVQASGISRDIVWTSPDYDTATRRVKMFVEVKVGDVVIRHA